MRECSILFKRMNYMIRSAMKEELFQVNELRKQVADMHRYARPDIFAVTAADKHNATMQATAEEMLNADDKDIVVYVEEGEVLGFVCVDYVIREEIAWAPAQRYCYIKELGVAEKARRKGIARRMMQYLQERSAQKGIHRMELDVWAFNESAMHLYEELGFRVRYSYMEKDFD